MLDVKYGLDGLKLMELVRTLTLIEEIDEV